MKNKNVIVTGGAGFVGANLAIALSKDNHVTVIDDLSTGHIENISDYVDLGTIEFIKGSITDLPFLQKMFTDVDFVFHQAALPSVPRSINDPATTNTVNVTGTLHVLLAAREHDINKVVYASSSSIYGDTPTLPKKESMTPHPLSPYAVSKLAAEYYCQVFTTVFDVPTVSLRYFNVYGPRQDPFGEYAAVIPRFITRILKDNSPVIYGDGTQTRDFTFIDDVVQANILAAEGDATGVLNIAGGKQISLNKLAELIMSVCKKKLVITYEAKRPGDIKDSLADITKAQEHIKHIPSFSIEQGLQETISWFQK